MGEHGGRPRLEGAIPKNTGRHAGSLCVARWVRGGGNSRQGEKHSRECRARCEGCGVDRDAEVKEQWAACARGDGSDRDFLFIQTCGYEEMKVLKGEDWVLQICAGGEFAGS